MGQAKRRGSFEQRQKESIERARIEDERRREYERLHPRKPLSSSQAAMLTFLMGMAESMPKGYR